MVKIRVYGYQLWWQPEKKEFFGGPPRLLGIVNDVVNRRLLSVSPSPGVEAAYLVKQELGAELLELDEPELDYVPGRVY